MRAKSIASLSLDLDNKWSYMKTHGDPGWESFPSYLDLVVPRFLDMLAQRDLRITVFVVGQDAALEKNHKALRSIANAGHEIGNHSFRHEPWLHLYTREQLEEEIAKAEQCIQDATGVLAKGFRGPGFSISANTLQVLANRGYHYDASTFPTFLGPLARAYYFMTAKFNRDDLEQRKKLFGTIRDGLLPLRPYRWNVEDAELTEIPVTTMPLLKIPFHVSYLLYLDQFSRLLALTYFRTALSLCRLFRVQPSLLLHPLDFMGCDDDGDLGFFPAMRQTAKRKLELVEKILDLFTSQFEVVAMDTHAASIEANWKSGSRKATVHHMSHRAESLT